MKKVLYISNIEVPYRVRFFNELAEKCDLIVLYERKSSTNRDDRWTRSVEGKYTVKYLNGISTKAENAFSFGILKEIFSGYDSIIIGCYNSPVQMLAIMALRCLRKPYFVNLDGEAFLEGNGIKPRIKRAFLKGACGYLTAGEKTTLSLKKVFPDGNAVPYYFSSMSEAELERNKTVGMQRRNDTILVVGQYYDCKGIDVARKLAQMDAAHKYKFVGMGKRTELFKERFSGMIPDNVEIIPFLQKKELEEEYRNCGLLLLPSRQECWGLVINEAASFGMPIVSTWGSGAAVEFLADAYPQYLAKPGDAEDLYRCIRNCVDAEDNEAYSAYLIGKSKEYTIERSVRAHLSALGIEKEED